MAEKKHADAETTLDQTARSAHETQRRLEGLLEVARLAKARRQSLERAESESRRARS